MRDDMSNSPNEPLLSPLLLRLMRGSFTLLALISVAGALVKAFDASRQVPLWHPALDPTVEFCLAVYAWILPDTAAAVTRRRVQALWAAAGTSLAVALLSLFLAV